MLLEHQDAEPPWSPREVLHPYSFWDHSDPSHHPGTKSYGHPSWESEPSPCNTLGMQLKTAQLPRCSQFGGRLNSQLLLRIRELNIWSGRTSAVSASSRCSGSQHILIAHTPGAGFLLSYVNRSGPVPAPKKRLFNLSFPGREEIQPPWFQNCWGICTGNGCSVLSFGPILSQEQELTQFSVPSSIPDFHVEQWGVGGIRGAS